MCDQNFQMGLKAYRRGDYETAHREFLEAAKQDHAKAQAILGLMYDNGEGIQKNSAEAARWYCRAAEQGDAEAQTNLGVMYRKGEGVQKNDAEAARWFSTAAEQNLAEAQGNLGLMYRNGEGISRDYIEAYKWFNLAAMQGLEPAAAARDNLQQNMSRSQIAQARARSREWRPSSDAEEK